MKVRRIQPVLLAALLTAVWCLDTAQAGEKIIFSNSKKKNGNKADLSVRLDKPALPTLDLTLMGARSSKAEEMAPVAAPPRQIDPRLLKKLAEKDGDKSDKGWSDDKDKSTDETDNPDNTDDKTEKSKLDKNSKERNRDPNRKANKTDKTNSREMDANARQTEKNDRLNPFTASSNTNGVDYSLAVPGVGSSATNHTLFGNKDNKDGSETTALGLRSLFSTKPNDGPQSRMRSSAFDPETERSETLRLLGIEPRGSSGSLTSSGSNRGSGSGSLFQSSALDALLGRGNSGQSAQTGNTGFGTPLSSQPTAMSGDGSRGFGTRDSVFKSGLMSEIGTLGIGQAGNSPASSYEPPTIEHKPLVLPVPQRKF